MKTSAHPARPRDADSLERKSAPGRDRCPATVAAAYIAPAADALAIRRLGLWAVELPPPGRPDRVARVIASVDAGAVVILCTPADDAGNHNLRRLLARFGRVVVVDLKRFQACPTARTLTTMVGDAKAAAETPLTPLAGTGWEE